MEWTQAMLVLRFHAGAVLDEEPCEIEMTTL
jgi:hypothetical protein